MNKTPSSSLDRRGGGCFVCHSSTTTSVVLSTSIEDTFFVFNKLFEIPADHCAKLLDQAHSAVQPSLSAGIKLQFCSTCKVNTESAKHVYQQLVVAVKQFRNIQRKLADAVKVTKDEAPKNEEDDHCCSLFFSAVGSNKARIFDKLEENAPFLVEDLKLKLERITGTSQTSQWKPFEVTIEEKQNNVEVESQSNEVKCLESDKREYVCENAVAVSNDFSHIEAEDDKSDQDFEPDKMLEPTGVEEEQFEWNSSTVNSPATIKEESDSEEEYACTDDKGTMRITAEDDDDTEKNIFIVKAEPVSSESEESTHSNSEQPGFQCSKCDTYSSTEHGLRVHLAKKHGKYGARRKSNKVINTKKTFAKRENKKTSQKRCRKPRISFSIEGKFKCAVCPKSFTRPYLLREHASRHTKQPMFTCLLCEDLKEFYTKVSLKWHERKFHPEIVSPSPPVRSIAAISTSKIETYECKECSKVFKNNSALATHNRTHGIEMQKERVCPEQGCGMVFTSLEKYRKHLTTSHEYEPNLKCSKCEKGFTSWKLKRRHEEQVHEDGLTLRPFICDLCGKGYTCTDYLNVHKHLSHSNKEKGIRSKKNDNKPVERLICDLCNREYGTKLSLRTHKYKFHGNKPEQQQPSPMICELCGNTYKSLGALENHMLMIHQTDKLKSKCHVCDKKFLTERQLAEHMFHHHDTESEDCTIRLLKSKVFQCPVIGCRKKFYQEKSKLDNHMKNIHGEDGEKPGMFKCKYCEKGFHKIFHKRHHEMIHENKDSTPYICDICQKGFPTPYYLQFHKKHTHKLSGVKIDWKQGTDLADK